MPSGQRRWAAQMAMPVCTPAAFILATGATRPVLKNVQGLEEHILAKKMLKRLGQPEDVAWCATYLASDESTWVTGADFSIDGGATAW